MKSSVRRQALKAETEPGAQRGLARMAGHGQRRIAELLPSVLLAKKLLGEVLLLRGQVPNSATHRDNCGTCKQRRYSSHTEPVRSSSCHIME